MYGDTFERLFGLGRDALLSGTHQCETHPVDGGSRYGLSVVLRPDPSAAARLATVGAEAAELTGAGHWPSGDADLVHFTVRSLERHRESVPPDDPAAGRYRAALEKAAGRPIRLRLAGLTLTPVSVMACAWPCDDAADQFATALAAALGEDGGYENGERDIWYANVLHFAGPVTYPAALVEWVTRRRTLDLGDTTIDTAELCQWVPDRRRPAPRVLATTRLRADGAPPVKGPRRR
jgi:hypothetical protein